MPLRLSARPQVVGVFALLLLMALMASCGAKPLVTNVDASRGTLYSSVGLGNIGSSACQPAPAIPAPPTPDQWWLGLDPQTRMKVVVGFEIWSHGAPGCTSHRQDTFRGMFEYNLGALTAMSTPSVPIATRITAATLTLTIQGFATPVSPAGAPACGSRPGGISSLMLLSAGTSVLTGMSRVATNNGVPDYPVSTRTITPISTLSFGGPGTAVATTSIVDATRSTVTIDVKNAVLFALNTGQPTVGFMLTGTGEAPTSALATPVQIDCKTLVSLGSLTVTNN